MKKLLGFAFAASLVSIAIACVPPAGSYGTYGSYQTTVTSTTGVYINGTELDSSDKQKLDQFLGVVLPAGRYFVDQSGMMGVEGQQASVNLVAIAKARGYDTSGGGNNRGNGGGGQTVINSRGGVGNGSFVSNGKCAIVSTPHGSITSGNC